jgi:hypothetical protein
VAGELGAVVQEAQGELDGVLAADPDGQASIALGLLEHADMMVLVGVEFVRTPHPKVTSTAVRVRVMLDRSVS